MVVSEKPKLIKILNGWTLYFIAATWGCVLCLNSLLDNFNVKLLRVNGWKIMWDKMEYLQTLCDCLSEKAHVI